MRLDADSRLDVSTPETRRFRLAIQILTTGLFKLPPDWPTGMAAPLQQPPAGPRAITA